ncbi:MAG: SPFH domain-containing protein [Oscillospiraceae bacterium]|nr:SPFH domain-containing protein [Oscillospiraceae bacterium]
MAIIDMVEWSPQNNSEFAYRFPHSNLSTGTQLIVHESQEAVFFSKGQILGKFGPGSHTLSTQNLPLLRNLFGIPFGGKNPFMAEVWFVNKTAPLNIDWVTTPMRVLDADYGQMLPLVATGRYGLKVRDAERFLVKLVGTMQSFTSRELTDHFKGAMIAKTNSSIMAFMNANHVGINSIAMHLDDLSRFIKQPMAEFWEDYGFNLEGFYITEVNLDTSSEEGRKISEAMSERSAQAIAGYTWQQKQSFNVAEQAANSNASMGILGVAMMTGAFAGGNSMGGAMMQPPAQNQYQFGANNPYGAQGGMGGYGASNPRVARKEVFCSNCSKKFSIDSAFCPHCGNRYNPCPACGADNSQNSTRCVTCGTTLASEVAADNICFKCHNPVPFGTRFCPICGNKLQ